MGRLTREITIPQELFENNPYPGLFWSNQGNTLFLSPTGTFGKNDIPDRGLYWINEKTGKLITIWEGEWLPGIVNGPQYFFDNTVVFQPVIGKKGEQARVYELSTGKSYPNKLEYKNIHYLEPVNSGQWVYVEHSNKGKDKLMVYHLLTGQKKFLAEIGHDSYMPVAVNKERTKIIYYNSGNNNLLVYNGRNLQNIGGVTLGRDYNKNVQKGLVFFEKVKKGKKSLYYVNMLKI